MSDDKIITEILKEPGIYGFPVAVLAKEVSRLRSTIQAQAVMMAKMRDALKTSCIQFNDEWSCQEGSECQQCVIGKAAHAVPTQAQRIYEAMVRVLEAAKKAVDLGMEVVSDLGWVEDDDKGQIPEAARAFKKAAQALRFAMRLERGRVKP